MVLSDDPIAVRSRHVLPPTIDMERRLAAALVAKDGPELLRLAREMEAAVDAKAVTTGCDVALTMMATAAEVLGNPATSLSTKRGWADSDGEFVAERIATFLSSCEEDAGSPHHRRLVTADLLKSF